MRVRLVLLALSVSASIEAQSLTRLIGAGDPVPGGDLVESFSAVAVAPDGTWGAILATDADDAIDVLVLVDGVVVLREGDPIGGMPGFVASGLNELDLATGHPACLSIVARQDSDYRSAAVLGGVAIAQELGLVGAPEFTPGTPWVQVTAARIGPTGAVLISGQMDDPNIPRLIDYGLVRTELDAKGVRSYTAVLKTDDPIAGLDGGSCDYLPSSARSFELAGDDHWIANVNFSGVTELDGYVLDGTAVVVRDTPSLVAGRDWGILLPTSLSVNSLGEHAYFGRLEGPPNSNDALIAKNGAILVQKGEPLPSIAPARIRTLDSTSVEISDAGRVLWYGDTASFPDPSEGGLFLDRAPLVRIGDPLPGGGTLASFLPAGKGTCLSADGRWVVFGARDEDGLEALYRIDLGAVIPMSDGGLNEGRLRLSGGLALPGESIDLALSAGPAPGSATVLFASALPAPGWPPLGLSLPFGELLIDPSAGAYLGSRDVGTWVGDVRRTTLGIPDDPTLAETTFYLQGAFFDPSGTTGAFVHLTGGLAVTVGGA